MLSMVAMGRQFPFYLYHNNPAIPWSVDEFYLYRNNCCHINAYQTSSGVITPFKTKVTPVGNLSTLHRVVSSYNMFEQITQFHAQKAE